MTEGGEDSRSVLKPYFFFSFFTPGEKKKNARSLPPRRPHPPPPPPRLLGAGHRGGSILAPARPGGAAPVQVRDRRRVSCARLFFFNLDPHNPHSRHRAAVRLASQRGKTWDDGGRDGAPLGRRVSVREKREREESGVVFLLSLVSRHSLISFFSFSSSGLVRPAELVPAFLCPRRGDDDRGVAGIRTPGAGGARGEQQRRLAVVVAGATRHHHHHHPPAPARLRAVRPPTALAAPGPPPGRVRAPHPVAGRGAHARAGVPIQHEVSREETRFLFCSLFPNPPPHSVFFFFLVGPCPHTTSYYTVLPLSFLPEPDIGPLASSLAASTALRTRPGNAAAALLTSLTRAPLAPAAGTLLFAAGSLLQAASHVALARLQRRATAAGQPYALPEGGILARLTCPHYSGEILLYAGLALLASPPPASRPLPWLVLAWVVCNLVLGAADAAAWYKRTFGRAWPTGRKKLVPGMW